ncbi:MAG: hypothetical protein KDB22_28985, partial [Planctomycetales bacterium]|nr:hypothetical protein [Planctomycetales bacterium]
AGDSSSLISEVPSYNDHSKLLMVVDRAGSLIEVTDPESWGLRRYHVVSNIQRHLQAPSAFVARVALDVEIESEQEIALQDVASEQSIQGIQIRQISYSLDANQRTRAQLYLPKGTARGSCNALVCMRQNPSDTDHERAMELARRGYVCILPDWTGDVKTSPAYDDVWQVQRAIDVLQACEIVHGERLGYIGDAAFGQLGLYAAAIDQRLVAIYCDAEEATSLAILQTASNHSLAELIATSAPRALRINLPRHAQLAQLVQDQAQIAREVFELRNVPQRLTWNHSGQMEEIYVWLEESFRRPQPRFAR